VRGGGGWCKMQKVGSGVWVGGGFFLQRGRRGQQENGSKGKYRVFVLMALIAVDVFPLQSNGGGGRGGGS
jgi:hypothetical protein